MSDTATTAVPTPPAWLNLAAIVDDTVVGRVAEVTVQLERLIDEVIPLIAEASRLMGLVSDGVEKYDLTSLPPEASDGVYSAVNAYAGTTRLHHTTLRLEDALDKHGLT